MNVVQAIAPILLSLSVILSSTGVRISQHWCGDVLVNSSIWGDAEPCEHFASDCKKKCEFHKKLQAASKKCCDEREVIVKGGDSDFFISDGVFTPPQLSISHLLYTPIQTVLIWAKDAIDSKYHNHSPPLIGLDRIVWNQSFLI